jgi:hypothetical protein
MRLVVACFQSFPRGYFVSLDRSCGSVCSGGTFRHCSHASWVFRLAELQCVCD